MSARLITLVGLLYGCRFGFDAPLTNDGRGEANDADADTAAGDALTDAFGVAVVIGDDPAELRDAELWSATPMDAHGGINHVSLDQSTTGLFWFDVSQIAPTSEVLAATLTISTMDQGGPGAANIHRMREAWIESEATWRQAAQGQNWSTDGAGPPSRDTDVVGQIAVDAVETTYSTALSVSMVQAWVADPAMNFGIALVRPFPVHVHVRSREAGARWASLTVQIRP